MMTVDDVEAAVRNIAAMAVDDEAAHSAEDDLRGQVLQAIADGAEDAPALAAAALKTDDIVFARWCA